MLVRLYVTAHRGFPFTDLKLDITLYNGLDMYFSFRLVCKFFNTTIHTIQCNNNFITILSASSLVSQLFIIFSHFPVKSPFICIFLTKTPGRLVIYISLFYLYFISPNSVYICIEASGTLGAIQMLAAHLQIECD